MDCEKVKEQIVSWLKNYLVESNARGFVVGVSGGVDSALVSTLCAMVGKTLAVSMPINQAFDQRSRAIEHIHWLEKFEIDGKRPVEGVEMKLDSFFNAGAEAVNEGMASTHLSALSLANMKSRLRMVALYAIANNQNLLVAGTGNKIEDYGVGFFTKYGDGGVDISPIGDLTKTEVRELAEYLGISNDIVNAIPTDGLWDDNRSDESQLGASYAELEGAMAFCEQWKIKNKQDLEDYIDANGNPCRLDVLNTYISRHEGSQHKMEMPPICQINR
jgi:NAD+ synthase